VLDGGLDPPSGRDTFVGENVAARCKVIEHSMVHCAKTTEPTDIPLLTVSSGPTEPCVRWGADRQGEGEFSGTLNSTGNLSCTGRCSVLHRSLQKRSFSCQ